MLMIKDTSIVDNHPIDACGEMLIFELPLPIVAARFCRTYPCNMQYLFFHRNSMKWLGYRYLIPQHSASKRLSAHWIPAVANSTTCFVQFSK